MGGTAHGHGGLAGQIFIDPGDFDNFMPMWVRQIMNGTLSRTRPGNSSCDRGTVEKTLDTHASKRFALIPPIIPTSCLFDGKSAFINTRSSQRGPSSYRWDARPLRRAKRERRLHVALFTD